MATQPILCRYCDSDAVIRYGWQSGLPRFRCKTCGRIFKTAYVNRASEPGVKDQIIEMAMNGGGVRDTARVLGVAKNTVMATLKKSAPKSSTSTPTSARAK